MAWIMCFLPFLFGQDKSWLPFQSAQNGVAKTKQNAISKYQNDEKKGRKVRVVVKYYAYIAWLFRLLSGRVICDKMKILECWYLVIGVGKKKSDNPHYHSLGS